jgi:DNA-binding transcriptional LysR family regulator
MNWQAVSFDWNQVRAFLATAEEGSLSAAARALNLTQPTLSRQVTALEKSLGVTLFERGTRAVTMTDAGLEILDHVREMNAAAEKLSLKASGQSQDVGGKVSITATSLFATQYLPAILLHLREVAPNILVNVQTSNTVQDLTQREADISIRHARPEQPDLIGRLVNETSAQLYGSRALVDNYPRVRDQSAFRKMPFIGFENVETMIPILREFGIAVEEKNIVATTSSGPCLLAMVRQGLGVSVLTKDTAERYADLEIVWPELEPIPVPVWLVSHRELNTSRRIRTVFDLLAEHLSRVPMP